MAGLRDESELYRKLDDMYKNKKSKDITQVFFNECIEVALKFSKRDIQFVLFKLKLLNVDVDSGIETVNNISNSLQKVLDANYAQTECQFRYCGTAIPFLTVRSTAR